MIWAGSHRVNRNLRVQSVNLSCWRGRVHRRWPTTRPSAPVDRLSSSLRTWWCSSSVLRGSRFSGGGASRGRRGAGHRPGVYIGGLGRLEATEKSGWLFSPMAQCAELHGLGDSYAPLAGAPLFAPPASGVIWAVARQRVSSFVSCTVWVFRFVTGFFSFCFFERVFWFF
jgi:hypothetical protein